MAENSAERAASRGRGLDLRRQRTPPEPVDGCRDEREGHLLSRDSDLAVQPAEHDGAIGRQQPPDSGGLTSGLLDVFINVRAALRRDQTISGSRPPES